MLANTDMNQFRLARRKKDVEMTGPRLDLSLSFGEGANPTNLLAVLKTRLCAAPAAMSLPHLLTSAEAAKLALFAWAVVGFPSQRAWQQRSLRQML